MIEQIVMKHHVDDDDYDDEELDPQEEKELLKNIDILNKTHSEFDVDDDGDIDIEEISESNQAHESAYPKITHADPNNNL